VVLFRALAIMTAVLALALTAADFARSPDEFALRPLPDWLALAGVESAAWFREYLPSPLAHPLVEWPAWQPLGILAAVFALFGWGQLGKGDGGGGDGFHHGRDRRPDDTDGGAFDGGDGGGGGD
jgi:hypothetical protein